MVQSVILRYSIIHRKRPSPYIVRTLVYRKCKKKDIVIHYTIPIIEYTEKIFEIQIQKKSVRTFEKKKYTHIRVSIVFRI